MLKALAKVVLLLAVSAAALSGCRAGSAPRAPAQTSADEETDWFCQEDDDSGEWKCIQDDALARNPEEAKRPTGAGTD